MDEIISYKMCAVKVCNAKLRNYLKLLLAWLLEFKVRNDQFRDTIMRKIIPLASKRTSYIATKAYLVSDIQGLFNNQSNFDFITQEC